jgi:hypothetical protein
MRYHRGLRPAGRGHYLILPLLPWILFDVFNIDPWPCISTTGGTHHSLEPNPKAVQGYAYQKYFTTLWMTVRDCFFSALYSPSWSSVSGFYFITFSFVTKSFSLTKYLLKSEEFCLSNLMRMGKISVVEAWCLAHRDFMGGTFCFFYKDRISGGWSCPIPDFVFLFLYQLRMAHHWNPDIPEDNERLHRKRTFVLIFTPRFCLLLLLSWKGAVFFW